MTMGDVIVLAVLTGIIALIVRGMIRDRKKGGCCGCSGCAGCTVGKSGCAGCPGCTAQKQ